MSCDTCPSLEQRIDPLTRLDGAYVQHDLTVRYAVALPYTRNLVGRLRSKAFIHAVEHHGDAAGRHVEQTLEVSFRRLRPGDDMPRSLHAPWQPARPIP